MGPRKGFVLGEEPLGTQSPELAGSGELVLHDGQELALRKEVINRLVSNLSTEQLAPRKTILERLIPDAHRCVIFIFDNTARRLRPETAINLPEEFIPVLAYNEEKKRLLTLATEQADPFLLIYLPGNKQFSFLLRLANREDINALWLVPWRDRDGSLLGALLFALSRAFYPDQQVLTSLMLLTDWMTTALREIRVCSDCERLRASFNNSSEATAALHNIGGIAGINRTLGKLAGWGQDQAVGNLHSPEHAEHVEPDVISVLSHELLSPLTRIKGYAATLLQIGEAITKEQKKQYLRGIEAASNRLTGLLENFRDISRLEAGTPNLFVEYTSLPDLLRKTISDIQGQTTKHVIKCSLGPSLPQVSVDRHKIEQVMTNLLLNAVKYSPQGGDIEVSVRRAGDEEGLRRALGEESPMVTPGLIVSVADSGIGIPDENLETVFIKFYRVDNRLTRTTSGSGLGLYICKIIVEAHGGRIWAESRVGGGSIFRFFLPVG